MMAIIEIITEAPSETQPEPPMDYNYENSGTSGTSENSDESQPIKKRPKGRPKGTGGKYTINPDQNRRNALGKKYNVKPKDPASKTSEQLNRAYLMRKKNNLDHYYRVRAVELEKQRVESERTLKIDDLLITLKQLLLAETSERIELMKTALMKTVESLQIIPNEITENLN